MRHGFSWHGGYLRVLIVLTADGLVFRRHSAASWSPARKVLKDPQGKGLIRRQVMFDSKHQRRGWRKKLRGDGRLRSMVIKAGRGKEKEVEAKVTETLGGESL